MVHINPIQQTLLPVQMLCYFVIYTGAAQVGRVYNFFLQLLVGLFIIIIY